MPDIANLQIALHVGAHKTATTHLQRSLLDHRPALAQQGVQVYGPPQLRSGTTTLVSRFGLQARGTPKAVAADPAVVLAQLAQGADRLVVSEENFIGTLQNRWGNVLTPLYAKAGARIAAIATAASPPLDVFLAIRNPASFLSSAYGQVLFGGAVVSAARFRSKNALDEIDWPDLVARIASLPGVGRVIVWRFEDYQALFAQVCAALLGDGPARTVTPVPEVVHMGLSEAAVAAIFAWRRAGRAGPLANLARDTFPVSDSNPKFSVFTPEECRAATAVYAAQVVRIAAMPKVTLLRP
jgi:hypothetical protein